MAEDFNLNVLWSQIFFDELLRMGLTHVCISPGSRSTPLTLATLQHSDELKIYSILDERSSGFFALGISKNTQIPTAVICTSGTAVANFLPAIIEAKQSNTPLIILTADRPASLRDSGSNQTMNQVQIFGDQVKLSLELTPTTLNEQSHRYLRYTACRIFATTLSSPVGPVHVNFPFNKPLHPKSQKMVKKIADYTINGLNINGRPGRIPHTMFSLPDFAIKHSFIDEICHLLRNAKTGIIVLGPLSKITDKELNLLIQFCKITQYPVFADPLSQIRFQKEFQFENLVTSYETFLQSEEIRNKIKVDLIFQIGNLPTSKFLMLFLEENPGIHRAQLSPSTNWKDDTYSTSHYIPTTISTGLATILSKMEASTWSTNKNNQSLKEINRLLKKYQTVYTNAIKEFTKNSHVDFHYVIELLKVLPCGSNLFVGNSLPVRHLDQFGIQSAKNVNIYGNRGVSGVDGTVSTASGMSLSSKHISVILVGDLAFLHDLNSLMTISKYNINLKIVILNNSGGGIFTRLPISNFTENNTFDDYFLTPNKTKNSAIQDLFGLKHYIAHSKSEFSTLFSKVVSSNGPIIIEIFTTVKNDNKVRKEFVSQYLNKVENLEL